MKVPITLSKFCTYVFTSALFVLLFAMLTHLLGTSRRPTTIEHLLVLFVLQFGTSIAVDFYRNWKKKPPTPPEAQ